MNKIDEHEKRITEIEKKIILKPEMRLIKNIEQLLSIECENKILIRSMIEKMDIFAVNSTEVKNELEELQQKIESRDIIWDGLLKSIIVEFDDHRKGLTKMYEHHGINCDDLKGWDVNNEIQPPKKKQKRGFFHGFFRKRRRITRKNKR